MTIMEEERSALIDKGEINEDQVTSASTIEENDTTKQQEKVYLFVRQTIYQLLFCSILILGILVVKNMNIGNNLFTVIKYEIVQTVNVEEVKLVIDKYVKIISNYKL